MRYYDIHTHTPTSEHVAILSIAYHEATLSTLQSTPHLSLSLHPWQSHTPTPSFEEMQQLASHPHVVAIGECGIDTVTTTTPLDIQEKLFITQIELAETVRKPLIIHCVRAFDRLLRLHKQYTPHQPWVIHGFRGKATLAKQLQQQGIYLSIGERFNADTLTQLDPTRMLLESDTSSLLIADIYQQVATTQGIEVSKLAQQIELNITELFGKRLSVK